jgi:hypothetical protein
LRGPGYPATLRAKIYANATFFIYNPAGVTEPPDPTTRWIALHKRGLPVDADGPTVELLIARAYALQRAALHETSRSTFSCPRTVDLTGSAVGICHATTGGRSIRVALQIVGSDWKMRPLDAIIPRSAVERAAIKHYSAMLIANGLPGMVSVKCKGPSFAVAPYPVTLDCTIVGNGEKPERLTIVAPRPDGSVQYDVEPFPT